ncbi:hypothetical protein NU688_30515 [Variovorax sp. ZS18.2.2]|uniref:hypothetical protein n=1 Tax=Variovorax sp. ZS18.2.2 TaxID=2971255 RepID=UPI0021514E82|nr:hypothetical protein [Variovorax sp. ZS18.2.2]MCR6480522.1 hypothetical protein [Variovorax sp. ZS18.2.2]
MNKLACRAAATLLMAALASCGGGGSGGESSIGLPAGQSPPSQSISEPAATPAVTAKAELQDPSGIQGLSAAQADSSGVVATLRGQGLDALSERAKMLGAISDSGSVSARFVPGGNPERYYIGSGNHARYMLTASGPDTSGTEIFFEFITQSEQTANGAMVRLNDATLTGNSATKNINGDASFAIGRWVTGTVTLGSGKSVLLTGDFKRSYHYLAFNELPDLPSGDAPPLICDTGAFTTPTYLDNAPSNAPIHGMVTASATVSFNRYGGADIAGAIQVTAGSDAGTVPLSAFFNSPSGRQTAFHPDKSVVSYMLGDSETRGTMMIALSYIASVFPSRARYIGVARLSCRPTP